MTRKTFAPQRVLIAAFLLLFTVIGAMAAEAVIVAHEPWVDVSGRLEPLDLPAEAEGQSAYALTLQTGPGGGERFIFVTMPRVAGAGAFGTGVGRLDPPVIRVQSEGARGHAGPPLGVSWNGQGWVARVGLSENQLLRIGIAASAPRIAVAVATEEGLRARSERDGRMRALLFGAALMLVALAVTRAMLARDGLHARAALLSLALAVLIALFADWHAAFLSPTGTLLGSLKAAGLAFFVVVAVDLARKAMDLETLSPVPNIAAMGLVLVGLVLMILVPVLPLLGGLVGLFAVLATIAAGVVVIEGTRQDVIGPKYIFGPWLLFALAAVLTLVLALMIAPRASSDISILMQALMLAGTLTATLAVDRLRQPHAAPPMATTPEREPRGGDVSLKVAIEGARKGVWDWRIKGDKLFTSASTMALLGIDAPGGWGTEEAFYARVHADDREAYRERLRGEVDRGTGHFSHEMRVLHEDGDYRWLRLEAEVTGGPGPGSLRISGLMTDISHEKSRGKQAMAEALHDPLTGLASRALFVDRIEQAERNTGDAAGPAVIVMDVDRFDAINDGIGHAGGDTLLILLARRIEGVIEKGQIGARLGGDEFGVLVELATDQNSVIDLADTLRDIMCEPLEVEGQEIFPSISLGVAFSREHSDQPHPVLRRAEIAMYHAKASGGGRVEVFRPSLAEKKGELLSLEAGLSRALERREVELLYQPVYSLKTGRLAGFEALMRWNHPEHGVMTPDRFLSLAEDTGAIVPLGRYVLEAAAKQLHAWQTGFKRAEPLFLGVNLSARQILAHDIARDVERLLERFEIETRTLFVEVTEAVIMENPELAAKRLHALRAEGLGLAIDDFGTGYSALSHLNRFPFDKLKIDRSFIEEMEDDHHVETVVKAIISLADDLGMKVIGEGIQSETQGAMLARHGCDFAQGFLFGKPITAAEAEKKIMEDLVESHNKPAPMAAKKSEEKEEPSSSGEGKSADDTETETETETDQARPASPES